MGLYNVVTPCVVEVAGRRLHYVRPTTAPIEVDDAVAAPLVEAGKLASISATPAAELSWPSEGVTAVQSDDDTEIGQVLAEVPLPEKPRRPRRPRSEG